MISAAEDRVKKMSEQMRFIKLYLKQSFIWSKTKTDLIRQELVDELFESIDELLSIRVSRLTGDAIEELDQKIAGELELISKLKSTTSKDLYIEDLNSMKLS
jgi:GTPase